MAQYWTCPHCGANLDSGERCDCQDTAQETGPPQRNQSPTHHQNHSTAGERLSIRKGGKGMKILKLTLENFQGIRKASFVFDGQSAIIYGNNAAGKTTVFNSVTWLLYGRASTETSGYTPKTRGGPDGFLHNLNHSAYGEFVTASGEMVTLQKIFHEVWKKKRGNAREEFSGHTIDYFLNGVPVKEKEYSAAVLAFCGEDREKQEILTRPSYFSMELPWKRRREILLDVCGDVSDADVIANTPALRELPDFLRMPGTADKLYSIDEYRKIANARRREINKELDGIPARIDEAAKALPDLKDVDAASVEQTIRDLQERIKELTGERAAALRGDDSGSTIRNAIANIRTQIAEGKAKHTHAQTEQNAQTNAAIVEAQNEASKHRRAKEEAEVELYIEYSDRERLSKRREELRAEYHAIFHEFWNPESEICPTCGQALPVEKVEQMRSDFNLSRSTRLAAKEKQGQQEASRDMIAARDKRITELKATVDAEEAARKEAEQRVRDLEAQLVPAPPYEQTTEYASLNRQIDTLQKRLDKQESGSSEAVAAIDEQIRKADAELQRAQENRSKLETDKQQRARISELKAREKELSAKLEHTEKGLYLCDEFTKAKVALLTERINSKFHRLRFQLFVTQSNGGVDECCEVLVPNNEGTLVPYQYANKAAKVNAGLEIIETLSRHWNMTMPVFVDDAEGVQAVEKVSTQLIRLVVPPSWESLSEMVHSALVQKYGSEMSAAATYEAENNQRRLEIREPTEAA